MQYQFPRTRFTRTNTLRRQLWHILSEVLECLWASYFGTAKECTIELMDVYGATETGILIIEDTMGPLWVQSARDATEKKNRKRGYYL